MGGPPDGGKLIPRHRPREQKALPHRAADVAERDNGFGVLDTLANDVHCQIGRQSDHIADYFRCRPGVVMPATIT